MKVLLTGLSEGTSGDGGLVQRLRAAFPNVAFEPVTTDEEQAREIRDADVCYGWPTREAFLVADRLRWVHCPATGINQISDIPELIESDTVLTNARGPHAPPMADHVFGMMLTLAHRLEEMWRDQRAHVWDPSKYQSRFVELRGRTIGILALGDIGTQVARRAHGFGMEVYAVDKHPMPTIPEVTSLWGLERLDKLLEMSDWFVITAPLTSETRGLIDRRRVGLLKEGAYVVTISRGGIIDEEALIEGLRSGRIAGAGLDVMAQEPLPDESPLWDMDNVVMTPHASALTPEMYEGRHQIFIENMRRFLDNKPFLYVCDKRAGF